MATIRSTLQLYDGMTPVLRSISNALNMTISSFESVQRASGHAIDTQSIQAARAELGRAEQSFNQVEREIRDAASAQNELNNNVRNGTTAADGLMGKFKTMAASLAAAYGAKQIIELSDSMTSTKSRLDLMNDGLQTTEQLQNKIMQTANASRTSYMDTAQVVGKLGILAGNSFSSSKQIVDFAEQMNKQFKIGGASLQESTSAMYQLTQAMASGKLQGDEFRSIMENAPLLAQAIAKYTGKSMGELKNMSSEGLITADIIKNAMFASADETNAKFKQMPMTFAQIGTLFGNTMIQTFQPLIQVIGSGAQFIYDNWSILEPVFWGLTTAVMIFTIALIAHAATTWLAVAANQAFMLGLVSNPLTWIAIALGVVVGAIYSWVQSVGGAKVAWMIACNVFLTAWSKVYIGFMIGGNAVMTFMGNLKVRVLTDLQNMVNAAITLINGFIRDVNKIPGVNIELISGVTFGMDAAVGNYAATKARNNAIGAAQVQANQAAIERQTNIGTSQAAAKAAANQNSALSTADSNNIAKTAANTGATKDATEEDLKYLRDIAEQEVINRFTMTDLKVEMNNHNNIASNMDIDGIISQFATGLQETIASVAEGV
jgi:tape measure domain-containing protein